MINRVTKDFETRSQCNLKKCGAFVYSLDPTTQPTCLAFKVLGEPTVYFLDFDMVNTPWKLLPLKLQNLWTMFIVQDYQFSAHNSFFERCIYDNILVRRYGWPPIPPRSRRCTAAKAAACALPRNLGGAGEAMKLSTQKDKRGYNAMMATCKPTKRWNAWTKARAEIKAGKKVGIKKRTIAESPEPPMFLEPDAAPDVWDTLYTYCKIDVRSEEELDQALPDLSPQEQEVWFLNQKFNWRGINVDIPLINKIAVMMEIESNRKLTELDSITMGLVTKPGARQSILDFLALEGIELPDIKAKTVEDELSGFHLSEDMRRLLELRKELSKTSNRKYQSFTQRAASDNRVRDIQLYHGASTGRDSGSGVQVQNFPRGLLKINKEHPYYHVENVIECDHEMLQLIYGDSLGMLFSAILRNMIIPTKGHEIFVADFSKIEVAVLWWMANNETGLKILRAGGNPYIAQAMENTGKLAEDLTEDDTQLAKAQILGGGFGMGGTKFQSTARDQYRLELSTDQSFQAIKNYRTTHSAVPVLWKAYEQAAIDAVKNPASLPEAGKCLFRISKGFLWIQLPSGRRLAYREPQISWRESPYGSRETLEFMAVNSKTKKWNLEKSWGGVLTENCVQATARDLLMLALLRLEKAGYRVLLSVHDEAICEKPIGEGSVQEFINIMCQIPEWAKGLPVEAKGWKGPRYRK